MEAANLVADHSTSCAAGGRSHRPDAAGVGQRGGTGPGASWPLSTMPSRAQPADLPAPTGRSQQALSTVPTSSARVTVSGVEHDEHIGRRRGRGLGWSSDLAVAPTPSIRQTTAVSRHSNLGQAHPRRDPPRTGHGHLPGFRGTAPPEQGLGGAGPGQQDWRARVNRPSRSAAEAVPTEPTERDVRVPRASHAMLTEGEVPSWLGPASLDNRSFPCREGVSADARRSAHQKS